MSRGLDPDGCFVREGALSRVAPAFAPVVAAALSAVTDAFGPAGGGPLPRSACAPGPGSGPAPGPTPLQSAYLYGSIPRGTARVGVSDLDLLLALHGEPTAADRAAARTVESALDAAHPQINGAGVLLFSAATLLSELERNDLGWFLACLCTPLLGEDLAVQLPRYRPSSLLARETNGDLALSLPRWHARAAAAESDAELLTLSRGASRKVVRTGFTLVMPRWNGWTSDLAESAEIFGSYYPGPRAEQMRRAAVTARHPSADRAALSLLIDDLGPWLAREYAQLHGIKAPRP